MRFQCKEWTIGSDLRLDLGASTSTAGGSVGGGREPQIVKYYELKF